MEADKRDAKGAGEGGLKGARRGLEGKNCLEGDYGEFGASFFNSCLLITRRMSLAKDEARRLCSVKIRARLFLARARVLIAYFTVATTIDKVIVHHADRLHVGVDYC